MEREEFDALVADAQAKNPVWFALERDPPASDADIAELERQLSVKLPVEFIDFLCRFGGGHFAFALVLGVEAGNEWEMARHLSQVPPGFVPASDAETGDYYGFRVTEGVCDRAVSVWDHDSSAILATPFSDFYEMLVERGLKP